MNKLSDKEKRFNFKRHQNAKKSSRMLIRFVVYSIVIILILYLILEKGKHKTKTGGSNNIEQFEIESD